MATASQVATEVKRQGGSDQQAWVAAALVSGIESNGQPTDKNPTSTACGLFQFLTTTWISNGGGKYAPTACGASWQQQVSVFLNASQGNNFYPWAPDLGGSYNGVPIYGPKGGSKVGNKISELAGSATQGSFFNTQVPTAWVQATDTGAANATTGLGSLIPGGGGSGVAGDGACQQTGGLGILGQTIVNPCQEQQILGALLMGVGALVLVVGFGIVLADVGLRKSAPAIVAGVIGRSSGKRSQAKEDGATKAARRTYDSQQRAGYNKEMNSGLTKRQPIGKTQPDRGF
jgi:hypothetical protein